MRVVVAVMVFFSGLAPTGIQQTRTVSIGENATIVYDTTIQEPDFARIESLIDLFFELHPTTPRPANIEIHALTFARFEIEMAKDNSPSWRQWLRLYQTQTNTRLMLGFVKLRFFPEDVVIYLHDLSDGTIAHELTHYACHTFAPQIWSGYHKNGISNDCISAQMTDFMHSLQFRSWLRDRPWNQER